MIYEELVKRLRYCQNNAAIITDDELMSVANDAVIAIEELQQTVEYYKGCSDDWHKEACDYKLMLPHWIPVTERLPEDGTRCLATRFDHVTKTPFLELLWFEGGEWWNRRFRGDFAVTHWMPLPEPPKEETCEAQ